MNIKYLQKGNFFFLLVALVFYSVGAYLIFIRGLVFCADSVGYLNYYSSQSPLYPILIKICMIFGGSAGYGYLLFAAQIIIGLAGIAIFSHFLYKQFALNKWIVLFLSVILYEPFYWLWIGNNMATESLAYPLFLVTMKYLLEGLVQESVRKYVLAFLFSSLLILTRAQFLFIYPLVAVILVYLLLFTAMNKRVIFKITLIFIAFIAGNFLLEKAYNYINGGTIDKAASGLQLATNVIYISTLQDSTLFSDKREREIFIGIMNSAEKKHLTRASTRNASNNHRIYSYNPLHGVIMETIKQHYKPEQASERMMPVQQHHFKYFKDAELMIIMGKVSLSISKTLLKHNWKDHVQLFFKSVMYELGYPINLIRKIIIGAALLLLLFTGKRTNELIVLLIAGLSHLLNLGLVASVETIIPRYSYYTEILLYVLFASVLFSFLGKEAERYSNSRRQKTEIPG